MGNIIIPGAKSTGGGEAVTGDYNAIDIEAVDVDYIPRAKEQYRIAKAIGAVLVKKYNNRQWKVMVDLENGMMIIACDSISNNKGYHIHMRGRDLRELQKRAIRAAGEILERHKLSRLKNFNPDVIETLPRDRFDNVIAIDAAPEPI